MTPPSTWTTPSWMTGTMIPGRDEAGPDGRPHGALGVHFQAAGAQVGGDAEKASQRSSIFRVPVGATGGLVDLAAAEEGDDGNGIVVERVVLLERLLASFVRRSASMPMAIPAPRMAPMLAPPTISTGIPLSSRARSTPRWAIRALPRRQDQAHGAAAQDARQAGEIPFPIPADVPVVRQAAARKPGQRTGRQPASVGMDQDEGLGRRRVALLRRKDFPLDPARGGVVPRPGRSRGRGRPAGMQRCVHGVASGSVW